MGIKNLKDMLLMNSRMSLPVNVIRRTNAVNLINDTLSCPKKDSCENNLKYDCAKYESCPQYKLKKEEQN